MSITISLYELLRTAFGHYKIFLLTNLKKGCFAVSAKDNIDKNATANLVQSHFLGTSILLFQLLDHENQGESLDCHGFIDAVYNIKKLAPRNQVRFTFLQRNFLLPFVDSIMKICFSILN